MKSASASRSSPETEQLASISLFKGLTQAQLTQVAQAAHSKKVDQGSFFYQEGDPADRVHILVQGHVRLTQLTVEGQQVILRYISPVEAFGVVAVLSEMVFPVSAEAIKDSRALTWDRESMKQLMITYPPIALNAIKIISGRVNEFQDRIRELATERVERRIARTLLRLVRQTGRKTPEGVLIDMPISRQDLAEMTGTTLFTVSRTLSQWESQGIIKSGRERITIQFPHGLVAIAEDLPAEGTASKG